ncbi:hypothetical protein ACK8P5_25860 (plasmid) [Paenibacillus sp. EC2-1]|uniref:hypothetical protein n=1 Tax=Paenibacillus sp. EC2-1 TaxID=3388665 RepID=UPI003BEF11D8
MELKIIKALEFADMTLVIGDKFIGSIASINWIESFDGSDDYKIKGSFRCYVMDHDDGIKDLMRRSSEIPMGIFYGSESGHSSIERIDGPVLVDCRRYADTNEQFVYDEYRFKAKGVNRVPVPQDLEISGSKVATVSEELQRLLLSRTKIGGEY